VNDADRVVTANDAIFGTVGGPVSVIVFSLSEATRMGRGCRSHGLRLHYGPPSKCARRWQRRRVLPVEPS